MAEFIIGSCLCLFVMANSVVWLVGVVAILNWLTSRGSHKPAAPMFGQARATLRSRLSTIRNSPEPLVALDEFIATLPLPAPPVSPSPQSGTPPAPRVTTPAAPDAATPDTGPSLPNWLQLDAITLLLYLGAALVVIAASVFVVSAWDVIPGLARWGLVMVLALGFLGTGELFVRWRAVLQRAGETFRNVGLLLLPVGALAFERFVLDGDAPSLYWLLVASALALFYYAFYLFSSADWLASTLASLSLGLAAFSVVSTLRLGDEWHAVAQLVLAGSLLVVAHTVWRSDTRAEPSLQASPLVATHLASGLFFWGVSLLIATALLLTPVGDEYPLAHLPYMLYAGITAALFLWVAAIGPYGFPLVGVGVALAALVGVSPLGWTPEDALVRPFTLIVWNALAVVALLLAPLAERWRRHAQPTLVLTALGLAGVATLLAALLSVGWLTASCALLVVLLLGTTALYRHPIWLLAAIGMAHLATLFFFAWLDLLGRSVLLLSLLWLSAAVLWLLLQSLRRLPSWMRDAFTIAFIAETGWAALYALSDTLAMLVVGPSLLLLWLLWGQLKSQGRGLPIATLFLFYSLHALVERFPMSPWLPALLLLTVGVALSTVAPYLPRYLRRTGRPVGFLLAALAPLGSALVQHPLAPSGLSTDWIGPLTLLVGGALHAALGAGRRDRMVVAGAGALLYGSLAWALAEWGVSSPQGYTAPLALLLWGYGWLFPKQRPLFEGVAVIILLLPALAQATSSRFLFTAILGGWGLLLLVLGILLRRRLLTVGGSTALILAALRQLWALISVLPPGFAIGVVGLLLMVAAVLLTLRRDVVIAALKR